MVTPGGEACVHDLLRSMCYVFTQNTELKQWLTPPRGMNGYQQFFRED